MPNRSSPLLPIVAIALCTVTTALLLREMYEQRAGKLPPTPLDAMRLVHSRILDDYVFERDPDDLVYAAIEGMVESLDKFSRFVPPDEVREFEGNEITGTYDGIGVLLVPGRTPPTVLWPFPGGPAERAGVHVGDEFLEIAGEPAQFETAARRLGGPTGSSVPVVLRRGDQRIDTAVPRGAVRKPAVKWAQRLGEDGRVGYVHVAEFQRGMVDAFDEAIETLREGGPLEALIVDVRGNSGGLLDEAVALTNRLLAAGTIVSLKRRDGEVVETHVARADACTLPDVPAAVLVDRRSASAAEVFAAALQDHARARVVGERTYGKGVVQKIYNWEGYAFRLKMTSSHYYTPNGRNLSKTLRREDDGEDPGGVDPDVPVALTGDAIVARDDALEAFEPPRRYRSEVEALAARLDLELPRPPSPDEDPVLAAALEDLRTPR